MIDFIRGTVAELTPTEAILEAAGVGYALSITLNTYTAVQKCAPDAPVRLFVYEQIREDAYLLYGFFTKPEREVFELLLDVSGIGGTSARMVLSAFSPGELAEIVAADDVRALKSVKGIGPKAAQRICLELKGKLDAFVSENQDEGGAPAGAYVPVNAALEKEAVQALSVLGFPPAAAQKVVRKIIETEGAEVHVETIIKLALKML